jgi:hypothetical protein
VICFPSNEIFVNLEGGIGNQLFQYSAGRYLAKKMNMTLILNSFGISSQRHGGFSIQQIVENAKVEIIYSKRIWKTSINLEKIQKPFKLMNLEHFWFSVSRNYQPRKIGYDPYIDKIDYPCVIKGNFQTFKFAENVGIDTELQIDLCSDLTPWATRLIKEISENSAISMHLRFGDYSDHKNDFGNLKMSYYASALDTLISKTSTENVHIFSNDINIAGDEASKLAKKFKTVKFHVVSPPPNSHPKESLLAMSKSTGLITANSSFSWWSAFLNPNHHNVIVPSQWFRSYENSHYFYLDEWNKQKSEWIL